jgi:hypothetical protein
MSREKNQFWKRCASFVASKVSFNLLYRILIKGVAERKRKVERLDVLFDLYLFFVLNTSDGRIQLC